MEGKKRREPDELQAFHSTSKPPCTAPLRAQVLQAGSDLGCQDCIDYIGSEFGGHAAKTMFAGRLQVSGRERPVLKVLIILEFAALRGAPNTGGGVNSFRLLNASGGSLVIEASATAET